jgi:hypothetical protein
LPATAARFCGAAGGVVSGVDPGNGYPLVQLGPFTSVPVLPLDPESATLAPLPSLRPQRPMSPGAFGNSWFIVAWICAALRA